MKLRVATYNIHKGVSAFGLRNCLHDLKLALSNIGADVLFLQEVQDVNLRNAKRFDNWPQEPQTRFLAGPDYHYCYGGNAVYDHGHHGNAILARGPFSHATNRDISDHRFEQRGMLHAVQHIDGVDVHCVNVHLSLFAAGRRRQLQTIIETMRDGVPEDAPVIIAGDFNDWHNKLTAGLTQALDVREVAVSGPISAAGGVPLPTRPARPARTFPAMLPWLGLDRIYVRGFHVESVDVMRGRMWARLSDHAPLVANLVLSR
ncbi:MAG TPA: endonuclease/exonuclease/phosphatase family protein [Burkholderiaceae bacterium]|nr:endonuclease/exonuclease/phosphatase family protein [Burkholderiaceae bacterium]